MAECKARGWNEVDVVFVSGDAYVLATIGSY